MQVTIVAANAFRFDSRLRRTALALAGDGHTIAIVAFREAGLPDLERLDDRITVHRVDLDRRIRAGLRPLPDFLVDAVLWALGIDTDAVVLPAAQGGRRARFLGPLRRSLEIWANLRRSRPWRDAVLRVGGGADVFHAKALVALPVIRAAAAARGARFVYDIADLHSEAARLARMPGPVRWLIRRRERSLLHGVAATFAVSDAVADRAAAWFRIARPTVVRNMPERWRGDEPLPDVPRRLSEAAGLAPTTRVILYQGGLSVDRGIEELVVALDQEPLVSADVAAVFLGYGRLEGWLRSEAKRRPGRMAVVDPVAPAELLPWTASADVSYIGFPPRTLNLRLALSNKLYESAMAGVPVIVAAGTEHARVVARDGLGSVTDVEDPRALGAAILELLDEEPGGRLARRLRMRRRALETDNWQVESQAVVRAYRNLGKGRVGHDQAAPAAARGTEAT